MKEAEEEEEVRRIATASTMRHFAAERGIGVIQEDAEEDEEEEEVEVGRGSTKGGTASLLSASALGARVLGFFSDRKAETLSDNNDSKNETKERRTRPLCIYVQYNTYTTY